MCICKIFLLWFYDLDQSFACFPFPSSVAIHNFLHFLFSSENYNLFLSTDRFPVKTIFSEWVMHMYVTNTKQLAFVGQNMKRNISRTVSSIPHQPL